MEHMERHGLAVECPKSLKPFADVVLNTMRAISDVVETKFGMSSPKTTVVLAESELQYVTGKCSKGSIHLGVPVVRDPEENLTDMVLTLIHEAGHVVSSCMIDEIFGEAFATYFALTSAKDVLKRLNGIEKLRKNEILENMRKEIENYEEVKARGTNEAAVSFLLELERELGPTAIGKALVNIEEPVQSKFVDYMLCNFDGVDRLLERYGHPGPIPFVTLNDERKYGYCSGVLISALLSHPDPKKAAETWKQTILSRIAEIAPKPGVEEWFSVYVNPLLSVVSEHDPTISMMDTDEMAIIIDDCMMRHAMAFQGVSEIEANRLCEFCKELFLVKEKGIEISVIEDEDGCRIQLRKT